MVVLIGLAGCAACHEEPRMERARAPQAATAIRPVPGGLPDAPAIPPRPPEPAADGAAPGPRDGHRATRTCLPPGPAVCTADGSIWATAEVSGRSAHPAVRSAAARRALTALATALGPGNEVRATAEVVRVAPCGPRTMAIARIPAGPPTEAGRPRPPTAATDRGPRVEPAATTGTRPQAQPAATTGTRPQAQPAATTGTRPQAQPAATTGTRPRAQPTATTERDMNRDVRPCASEVPAWAARRTKGTCPEWAEAYALRDSSTIVGIGHGPRGKNRSLATSVAVNRARSHAARLAHFDLQNPNLPVRSHRLRELTRNIGSCAGRIIARVGYAPED